MKTVRLEELFQIQYGNGFELMNMVNVPASNPGAVNFIARTAKNNGIVGLVELLPTVTAFQAGKLTVSLSGSVLESFVQPRDFYTSFHVFVLTPKRSMNERELVYYSVCIRKNKYRYSYGRQANRTLKTLQVPVEVPQKFLKLKVKRPFAMPFSNRKLSLSDREWKWFKYPEVFEVIKGHYNNRPQRDEKGIPFISATENNNGITDYVVSGGTKVFPAKRITVSNDGSVGNAFYQEKEFTCSHSVNIVRIHPKYNTELNQYIALFLIPLIQKEKYRFGYGFKWRIERMKQSKIKLPVDKKGNPDWQFMEGYIKSLPYSANL